MVRWFDSLRGRRLKGMGKGVLGARETRLGAWSRALIPFPSLSSACHAGEWLDASMDVSISKCLAAAPVFLFSAPRPFVLFSCEYKICAEVVVHWMFAVFLNSLNGKNRCVYVRNLHLSPQFDPLGILRHISVLSLVASRVSHSTQPVLPLAPCRA